MLAAGLKKLESLLKRDVEKGRISAEDGDMARERVKGVEIAGDLVRGDKGLREDTDLVIEVNHISYYCQ